MLPTRVTMPATLLGLILAAQSAQADLTPEQVWEDWRSYIGGFGNEVSATETLSGDSLVVSDVLITTNIPEDQGSATNQTPAFEEGFLDAGS